MTLSKNSKTYKVAFFALNKPSEYETVSLCKVFWGTVFSVVLTLLVLTLVCAFIVAMTMHPVRILVGVGLFVAYVSLILLLANSLKLGNRRKISNTVLYQAAKAVKGKFCPLIQITQ